MLVTIHPLPETPHNLLRPTGSPSALPSERHDGRRRGPRVRREWEPEALIERWTLVGADWELVANKSGATRLGFAVLLKFFELEGRFPRHAGEVPRRAVTGQGCSSRPGDGVAPHCHAGW